MNGEEEVWLHAFFTLVMEVVSALRSHIENALRNRWCGGYLGPRACLNTTVVASPYVLASLSQIVLGLIYRVSVAYVKECWKVKKRDTNKLIVTKINCRRSSLIIQRLVNHQRNRRQKKYE